jgi:hypothetical protein
MARADHIAAVEALVRDTSASIEPDHQARALDQAVTRYGLDRPRHMVEDLTVAGVWPYLAGPAAGWVEGWSQVRSIEHPVDAVPPALLSPGLWVVQAAGILRLAREVPDIAGATIRVTCTAPHILDDTTDTIPAWHAEPVQAYAAAQLLRQLAAATAGDEASTFQADAVQHGSKSSRYAARARDLLGVYAAGIKLDAAGAGQVSASASAEAPARFGRLLR